MRNTLDEVGRRLSLLRVGCTGRGAEGMTLVHDDHLPIALRQLCLQDRRESGRK